MAAGLSLQPQPVIEEEEAVGLSQQNDILLNDKVHPKQKTMHMEALTSTRNTQQYTRFIRLITRRR